VEADVAVFHRLLARADVLVENYRPGVMERLGLGWESLHDRHPNLIYAATSGFGHSGPYAQWAAFDLVAQAMGGLMSITGHPGGEPTRAGTSIGDITAGLFTAVGINSALFHRAKTGEAIKVDVAMLDCQVAITESAIARHFAGERLGPIGARHPGVAPFDAFPVKGGHIVIAIVENVQYEKLCSVVGRADLAAEARFATNALRLENHQALKDELSKALASKTGAEWLELLRAAGLPCGPINTVADMIADPQVAARNMIVVVDDATAGKFRGFGCPIKMSAFEDPRVRGGAPDLDADRERILRELQQEER
jgi:CoA:oxalate CoA-transferase